MPNILFFNNAIATITPNAARSIVANYLEAEGFRHNEGNIDRSLDLYELPIYKAIGWLHRADAAPVVRTATETGNSREFMFLADESDLNMLNETLAGVDEMRGYEWRVRDEAAIHSFQGDNIQISYSPRCEKPRGEGWEWPFYQWQRVVTPEILVAEGYRWIGTKWVRHLRQGEV